MNANPLQYERDQMPKCSNVLRFIINVHDIISVSACLFFIYNIIYGKTSRIYIGDVSTALSFKKLYLQAKNMKFRNTKIRVLKLTVAILKSYHYCAKSHNY